MQATKGFSMESGADWEVRPVTRRLPPREREMKDSVNSGELLSRGQSTYDFETFSHMMEPDAPNIDQFLGFLRRGEVVDVYD